jgi:hypothetical protein
MAEATKEPAKNQKGAWKIISKILDWIVGIFMVLIAVIEFTAIFTKNSNYGVPTFFGYQISYVATPSMAVDKDGKEVYPVNDGIVVKKVDYTTLSIGDDITFYGYYYDPAAGLVTVHRIIDKQTDSNGKVFFVTQGTNPAVGNQCQIIYQSSADSNYFTAYMNGTNGNYPYVASNGGSYSVTAMGVYMGKVVSSSKFLGWFYVTLKKPWALLLMIIIPCLVIAATSIGDIVKLKKTPDEKLEEEYGQGGKEKTKPDPNNPLAGLSEEDKKKLKQEMIDQMIAEQQKKGGDSK